MTEVAPAPERPLTVAQARALAADAGRRAVAARRVLAEAEARENGPWRHHYTSPVRPDGAHTDWRTRHVVQITGKVTLADLMDLADRRGLLDFDVQFGGGHVTWDAPETPDERAAREERHRVADARRAEWESEQREKWRAILAEEGR